MRRYLLLLVLLATPVFGQEDGDIYRPSDFGFRPEYVYDLNDVDTINVTTGNLLVSIPLGISYPVGEGLSR